MSDHSVFDLGAFAGGDTFAYETTSGATFDLAYDSATGDLTLGSIAPVPELPMAVLLLPGLAFLARSRMRRGPQRDT